MSIPAPTLPTTSAAAALAGVLALILGASAQDPAPGDAEPARRDRLAFAPDEGSRIVKVLDNVCALVVEECTLIVDGEDQSDTVGVNIEMKSDVDVEVLDVYGATMEGLPERVTRTFRRLGATMDVAAEAAGTTQGAIPPELEAASALEGQTVVFVRQEDGSYGREFASPGDDEGESPAEELEALLAGLAEDMDLRALLPEEPVAPGDAWSVDLEQLPRVLNMGGDLAIRPEKEEATSLLGPSGVGMHDLVTYFGRTRGEAVATYRGPAVDAPTVGAVELRVDVKSAKDITQKIEAQVDDFGLALPGVRIEADAADAELTLKGTGELLWDLEAQRFSSFRFDGDLNLAMDVVLALMDGRDAIEMEMYMEMSVTISLGAEARTEE